MRLFRSFFGNYRKPDSRSLPLSVSPTAQLVAPRPIPAPFILTVRLPMPVTRPVMMKAFAVATPHPPHDSAVDDDFLSGNGRRVKVKEVRRGVADDNLHGMSKT